MSQRETKDERIERLEITAGTLSPSPKEREEREESSSADRYLLHAEWVAKTMLRHYPSAEDGREDTLERESAHVIRRLLARLRTHSPEEPVGEDEIRVHLLTGRVDPPTGSIVISSRDGRWSGEVIGQPLDGEGES